MSTQYRKRYFINKLLNAQELKNTSNARFWKPKIVDHVEKIRTKLPPRMENSDGGLYVGSPGIAYLFYCLIKSPIMESQKKEYIFKGKEYLMTAEQYVSKKRPNDISDVYGFLLGKSGFHAVAAALYSLAGNKAKSEEHLQTFVSYVQYSFNSVPYGGNELFVGRAGYLMGALWLSKELKKPVLPTEKINEICNLIVNEGRTYRQNQPIPLMYAYYKTEYIGAAHGISAILYVLLCCEDFLANNRQAEEEIRLSVDTILALQTSNGNFPCSFNELDQEPFPGDDNELVHWCHGAPGVIYMMAKAYLRWKDEKYLVSCTNAADLVWQKGLLKKGPGICHGVAGNGYVFLLMYRLTRNEQYLRKAAAFAEFMSTSEFRNNARSPDAPYSLYEGIAGAICYLLDVHNPDQAAFPFMDVF